MSNSHNRSTPVWLPSRTNFCEFLTDVTVIVIFFVFFSGGWYGSHRRIFYKQMLTSVSRGRLLCPSETVFVSRFCHRFCLCRVQVYLVHVQLSARRQESIFLPYLSIGPRPNGKGSGVFWACGDIRPPLNVLFYHRRTTYLHSRHGVLGLFRDAVREGRGEGCGMENCLASDGELLAFGRVAWRILIACVVVLALWMDGRRCEHVEIICWFQRPQTVVAPLVAVSAAPFFFFFFVLDVVPQYGKLFLQHGDLYIIGSA